MYTLLVVDKGAVNLYEPLLYSPTNCGRLDACFEGHQLPFS